MNRLLFLLMLTVVPCICEATTETANDDNMEASEATTTSSPLTTLQFDTLEFNAEKLDFHLGKMEFGAEKPDFNNLSFNAEKLEFKNLDFKTDKYQMTWMRTNDGVQPYKFMDDLTFVGVPLFVAGIIAKS